MGCREDDAGDTGADAGDTGAAAAAAAADREFNSQFSVIPEAS